MRNYRLGVMMTLFLVMSSFITDGPERPLKLTFTDHLKAGLIEVDAFVEKTTGSNQVYRVLPDEREKYLDAPLFATTVEVHHDPFEPKNAGPYPKGAALGLTLREWLGASGSATYQCEGGWGTFHAEFKNLVPNSVYTMWHFFMPAPPTVPFTGTLDVPMGERDGSQSVFTTDSNGNTSFNIRFEHCLQLGENQLMSGVAIAYHRDMKTYGPLPGEFGKVTHVQLFAMLPNIKSLPDNSNSGLKEY
ncbi:hypothetical protein [Marinoscillum sp.]|uniref:hypothetical protein n=1 Tax=Marinoscillum sp. TaxID=2024838 RepID=UPI003BAB442A